MHFTSFEYLALLGLTLALYHRGPRGWRPWVLLAASVGFYCWWNVPLIAVLVVVAAVDFAAGLGISGLTDPRARRRWLAASLAGNLLILGFFKYAGFITENLRAATGWPAGALPALALVLPLGISFHTFQAMAYSVDVYRGDARATRSFPRFVLFVLFFPQLVAGPIERARRLLTQLERVETLETPASAWPTGLLWIAWGFFQKLVLADNAARVADAVFDAPSRHGGAALLLGVYAFSAQIFFDFSGYTDIARGSARLLGIDLVRNFRWPYLAVSPSDFWRRWHVSLSEWFRDYVYVPLGGNRGGRARTVVNLAVTMALAGLWHGAAWTFVAWGLYHGALLALYRVGEPALLGLTRRLPGGVDRVLRIALMFHLTAAGWVLFRARSLEDAAVVYRGIGTLAAGAARDPLLGTTAAAAAVFATLLALMDLEDRRGLIRRALDRPWAWGSAVAACLIAVAALAPPAGRQFIYFQF